MVEEADGGETKRQCVPFTQRLVPGPPPGAARVTWRRGNVLAQQ